MSGRPRGSGGRRARSVLPRTSPGSSGSSGRGGPKPRSLGFIIVVALAIGGSLFVAVNVWHAAYLHDDSGRAGSSSSSSPLPIAPVGVAPVSAATAVAPRRPPPLPLRLPLKRASLPSLPPLPHWDASVALHDDEPALRLWKRADDVGALFARFSNLTLAGERSERFGRIALRHFAAERATLRAAMRHVRLRLENLLTLRLFGAEDASVEGAALGVSGGGRGGARDLAALEEEYAAIAASLAVLRDVAHDELAKARSALNSRGAVRPEAERDVTVVVLAIRSGERVARRVRELRGAFPLIRVVLCGADDAWLPPLGDGRGAGAADDYRYVDYIGNVPLDAALARVQTQFALVLASDAVALRAPAAALPALLTRAQKSSLDLVGGSVLRSGGSGAAETVCDLLDTRVEWVLTRTAMAPRRWVFFLFYVPLHFTRILLTV